jgi:hypothetical protein
VLIVIVPIILSIKSGDSNILETGEILKIILTEKQQQKENFDYTSIYMYKFPEKFVFNYVNYEDNLNLLEKCIRLTHNKNLYIQNPHMGFVVPSFFRYLSEKNLIYKTKKKDGRKDLEVLNAGDAREILLARVFTSKNIPIQNKKEFITSLFILSIFNFKLGGIRIFSNSETGIYLTKEDFTGKKEFIDRLLADFSKEPELYYLKNIIDSEITFKDFSQMFTNLYDRRLGGDWSGKTDPYLLLESKQSKQRLIDMEIDYDDMFELNDESGRFEDYYMFETNYSRDKWQLERSINQY